MEVVRHPKLEKRIELLSPKIRLAFANRLELFLTDPHHPLLNNHALSGERHGFRSLNITGDWCLIYKKLDEQSILLTEIGTHHNLYGT